MEWLIERFRTAPDRTAFVHEGRSVSYGEVVATVAELGARLEEREVGPGDTVAVVGDYSPEVFCMLLALVQRRCTVVPLTPASVVEESVALGVSGCDWYVRFDDEGALAAIEHRGLAAESALLTEFRARRSPGLVLFSSGTSGRPKGMLHDFARVAEKFRRQRAPVVAIPFLMMDHFGGINTLLAITSSLGRVVTVADRSVASICAAIARERVQLLPATPSFLTLLMASNAHREHDLSSLTRITYGTEVMPQATLDRVRAAFPGVVLQQTYGLSEVGVLRSESRDDGSLWMRIGGEGFQTRVVDGVLWIRSDYAMVGYLNAPSEFDDEGWFNTQDEVEVDGDWFRVLGRVTDLINVGGQKVYPAEVEGVVLGVENVQDVAVHGEEHGLLGQIVVATVVLERPEPVEQVKRRMRQVCAGQLAGFKVPVKVVLSGGPLHSSRHKKVRRG
ncbi:class I adenylate-forming enzyme family protein [Modestobacter sp. VKM Ac-2985]|uniref:class I adenylate-forming enzyme family protein n=1 Tax=Modestobacter sp. VKM Ac-2985 TaxID=3004139 RepID=UPI0022ABB506|nr:long-chain fatty acid--CoA ligase [Modestobacter sp. VKM Ac-2985]MCZ2836542.1 AMP-binding protein [Modestobacter sp. VKM Ac-2985]